MEEHLEAIRQYAAAYERLEQLQRRTAALLPIGDQKTGVIAEFYARIYAQARHSDSDLVFGTPSEHVWDIKVRTPGRPDHLIQVKGVSAHSRTNTISVIHPGWHELYLLRLDSVFWPIGFWSMKASDVAWSSTTISSSKMPKRDVPGSGSSVFSGATDRLDELLSSIESRRTK